MFPTRPPCSSSGNFSRRPARRRIRSPCPRRGTAGFSYGAVVPVPNGYCGDVHVGFEPHHHVYVRSTGTSTCGFVDRRRDPGRDVVNATQTLVNSAGNTTVPRDDRGFDALGPISGSASLTVVTAEAASVQDTKAYAPVTLTTTSPTWATRPRAAVSPADGQRAELRRAARRRSFAQARQLARRRRQRLVALTSIVASAGAAGSISSLRITPAPTRWRSAGTVNSSNVLRHRRQRVRHPRQHGAQQPARPVTMAWRPKHRRERLMSRSADGDDLPAGVQWLTSDVVDIEGVPSTARPLPCKCRMTMASTRLGRASGTTASVAGSYIAKLVTTGPSAWENAVLAIRRPGRSTPQTGV